MQVSYHPHGKVGLNSRSGISSKEVLSPRNCQMNLVQYGATARRKPPHTKFLQISRMPCTNGMPTRQLIGIPNLKSWVWIRSPLPVLLIVEAHKYGVANIANVRCASHAVLMTLIEKIGRNVVELPRYLVHKWGSVCYKLMACMGPLVIILAPLLLLCSENAV